MNDKLACSTLEMLDKMIEEVNKKTNITPAELDALTSQRQARVGHHAAKLDIRNASLVEQSAYLVEQS